MTYREPAKIVMDVLQSEMGLTDGQVLFTNQKFFIPTEGLLIVVSYLGPSKVIGSASEWIDDGSGGLTEVQSVVFLHLLNIDLLSFGDEARLQKEDVAMALRSIYSEQLQEQYQIQIARHPGAFLDTSFLEETKRVTRYTTTVLVQAAKTRQKPVDSYLDFSRAVPPQEVVNA